MNFFNSSPKRGCASTSRHILFASVAMAGMMLLAGEVSAQSVSLTALGTAYTQDFNTLSSVAGGTVNALTIPGWSMIEYGNGGRDNDLYAVDAGTSATGDTYSYGSVAATDRALGSLRSSSLFAYYGASFTNNTGSTITSLVIGYTGEQWRLGTAARADQLTFEYSLDAVDVTTATATWNGVAALNFTTPDMATTGAKNGNAASERTVLTATITSLSIPSGATFWIRWTDVDAASNDDGLAVDDFTLTPLGAVTASPEIDVQGNALSIISGDATPSVTDNTDFGSQSVCTGVASHPFSILNTGTANLNLTGAPIVSVSGPAAADFAVTVQPSSPVAAAGSSNFVVAFDPSAAGVRSATISIANDDSDENPYVFTIQGTGVDVTVSVPSQTNISCFGNSNGMASVTATGNGTLSYDWAPGTPTGDGTASVTGLTAGDYTVTVTDAGTCSATQTLHISEPAAIMTSVSTQSDVSCFGANNGSATISASGGTGSLSYSWAPSGGTGATATNLSAGDYTVTVADANSCTATQTLHISEPAAIMTSVSTQSDVSCFGANNGSATISASGGTGSLSYSWTPSGGTSASATNLSGGTYTVTVADANSCTATQTLTINEPSAIVATSTQTNASCGNPNGIASVSASGGTGAFTYSWSPSGGTAATATGLGAGVYTVTISDASACSATQTVNIIASSNLTATTTQTDVACHGGNNGVATVNVSGGTPAYTYSWAPSGGTGATASGLAKGNYTCTITDNGGCSTTATVAIHQPATMTSSFAKTDVTCNGGSDASVIVSGAGGTAPLNYTWMPGSVTSATLNNVAAGIYTCTISDVNSCSITQTVSISEPAPLTATLTSTDITCNGLSNGSATVSVSGGTPVYSYSWSPAGGNTDIATNLAANNYTCFISDANLCSASVTVTVNEPAAIVATTTQTNITCGNLTGAASVSASGGTGTLTYSWSPSGGTAATATGLSAGAYTVTVSDASACSVTQTVDITSSVSLVASATETDVTCHGGNDGIAMVNASGGTPAYTYSWAPSGGTAATATNLAKGNYTCTVTDNTGCSITTTVAVHQPAAISASFSQSNVTCNGGSDASVIISATGGTGSLNYTWMPGSVASATLNNVAAGIYTCTISDANLCSATQTVSVSEPASMTVTVAHTDATCNGLSNGTANVSVNGGTPVYSYSWSPAGGSTDLATGLAANNYTCFIADANLCPASITVTVNEPAAIAATTTQTNASCGNNGIASVSASGGTGAFTYSWSPSGGTAATETGLGAGVYTVTISDASACSVTQTVNITSSSSIVTSFTQTNVSCFGGNNGSATVIASGGTGSLSYSWMPSGGNASTATGLLAGTYSVIITDAASCSTTQTVSINEPAVLTATVAQTDLTCNGIANGSATVTVTGGTPVYSYTWTPATSTSDVATGLSAGTYTCAITDNNMCATSVTVTINEPAAITAASTQTDLTCNGSSTGAAAITANGGTGTLSYTWMPSGGNAATASNLAAGDYTVTIADANACNTTQTLTIQEPTAIVVSASSSTIVCNGGIATITVSASGGYAPYTGAGTFTAAAGTYTYPVTDDNGCTASTTITVTEPVALGSSQTLTLCAGQSLTVGTNTYTATGTYTDVLTSLNGCDSTVTTDLTVNMPVDVTTTTSGLSISANATPAGYQWIDCDNGNSPIGGETSQVYTPTADGNYAVIVTVGTCSATSSCVNILVSGINELAAIGIDVYPNPNDGNFTVNLHNGGSYVLQLTDVLGKTMLTQTVQGKTLVNAQGLPEGIYTLIVSGANGTATHRLVITK